MVRNVFNSRNLIIATIATTVLMSGCTRRLIDYTVISSKTLSTRYVQNHDRVEGKDEIYWLLWFPLGVPNLKEATDRAIESAGPGYDALVDGVVYSYNYWFILTGITGYRVEGTPVRMEDSAELLQNSGQDLAMKPILYHSSLGLSNEASYERIGVIDVGRVDPRTFDPNDPESFESPARTE